jgi:3-oxoacyl-[acyl-carrier-protein] synthase II
MVFEKGIIPPTINLKHPITDLDFVPNKARIVEGINYILINSHGLGGANSCLVVRKYEK